MALPFNAGHVSLIPSRGGKIPQALKPKSQNIKQQQYCNKFSEDFKMVYIKTNKQMEIIIQDGARINESVLEIKGKTRL